LSMAFSFSSSMLVLMYCSAFSNSAFIGFVHKVPEAYRLKA
jgi:hypothetical protein